MRLTRQMPAVATASGREQAAGVRVRMTVAP